MNLDGRSDVSVAKDDADSFPSEIVTIPPQGHAYDPGLRGRKRSRSPDPYNDGVGTGHVDEGQSFSLTNQPPTTCKK